MTMNNIARHQALFVLSFADPNNIK